MVDRCKDNTVTVEFSFKNGKTSTKVKVPKKNQDIDCKGPNMPINLIVGLSVGGLIGVVVLTILLVLYKPKRKPNTVMNEDFKPNYGVCSAIYRPSAITRRNSAYAAAGIEDTSATVFRVNNRHNE